MSPKAPKAPKAKEAPKVKDEAEVTCPVCAGTVTLDEPFCPHCGAEFEEEEVEEIIEEEISTIEALPEAPESEELELFPESEELSTAETKFDDDAIELSPSDAPEEPFEVAFEAPPAEETPIEEFQPEPEVESDYVEEVEEGTVACPPPKVAREVATTGLTDLRVIGISMLLLGIIGAVVMFNIKWFWLWVPAIQMNILPYALVGVAIILLSFIYLRKMAGDTSKGNAPLHPMLPSIMLALILFGFMTTILFILAKPINEALKSSQIGVSVVFVIMVVLGLLLYIIGSRTKSETSAGTA